MRRVSRLGRPSKHAHIASQLMITSHWGSAERNYCDSTYLLELGGSADPRVALLATGSRPQQGGHWALGTEH